MHPHFVGRVTELERLQRLLAEAVAGRGRLATVAGEAGIGKTRLMTEAARLAEARGCRVLWSQLLEDPITPPFHAWLLVMRDALAGDDLDQLRADLGSGAGDVADLVPELRDRLGLAPTRPSPDSAAARFQLSDSVTRFLLARARRRPQLLLFDNAHRADRSSLALLEYFVRQLANSPTLVLLSYRDSEVVADHPLRATLAHCARTAGHEELALGGLARGEAADLLRAVLGGPPPAPLADAVWERGDGNPLFVSQVAAGFARRLAQEPGTAAELAIQVPDSLRAVIAARLATLDAETLDLLRVAAVLGREFEAALLARLADRPVASVFALLERAVVAGTLVSAGPGRWRYVHALFREVLYAQHSPERRLALHRTAVARLEQRHAADLDPWLPQLAYHAFEAARDGDVGGAVDYCRRAAVQALARRAYGEAVVQFEHALQVAELHESPDLDERYALLAALGDAQFRSGQLERSAHTWLRAALLAKRLEWWPRLADAVLQLQHAQGQLGIIHLSSIPLHGIALEHLPLETRATRARLLASLASACRRPEDRARGREAFDESIRLAREVGDDAVLFECLSKALLVLQATPVAREQAALLGEALALAERTGVEEAVLAATSAVLFPLSRLGDYARLQPLVARLGRHAEAARHPHYRQVAAGFEAQVAILQGRWQDALKWAQASLQQAGLEGAVGVEGRFGFQMFTIQRALGGLASVAPLLARLSADADPARLWLPGKILLHCELGQYDEARRLLERLGDLARLPSDDLYETALVYLAEACVQLRDLRRCEQLYAALEPYREFNVTLGGTVALGAGAGYLALLATTLRRPREARALFEEALAFDAAMGAPPLVARVQVDYAACLLASERPADRTRAGQLLREAAASAAQFGLRALQARIESLAGADAAAEALTDRELEVLQRIAHGASNKRIALELQISLSTVATHIRSILKKTGTRNRTAAVAHARRARQI